MKGDTVHPGGDYLRSRARAQEVIDERRRLADVLAMLETLDGVDDGRPRSAMRPPGPSADTVRGPAVVRIVVVAPVAVATSPARPLVPHPILRDRDVASVPRLAWYLVCLWIWRIRCRVQRIRCPE